MKSPTEETWNVEELSEDERWLKVIATGLTDAEAKELCCAPLVRDLTESLGMLHATFVSEGYSPHLSFLAKAEDLCRRVEALLEDDIVQN